MTPDELRERMQRAIEIEQQGGTAAQALQAAFGDRETREPSDTRPAALSEALRALFTIGRRS